LGEVIKVFQKAAGEHPTRRGTQTDVRREARGFSTGETNGRGKSRKKRGELNAVGVQIEAPLQTA